MQDAYDKFGNHRKTVLNTEGFYFAVWAPQCNRCVGDRGVQRMEKGLHPLFVRLDHSGIWEGFIPHIPKGTCVNTISTVLKG